MIKIRKDIDLRRLQDFGMKPKYDEDTGEIYAYAWNREKILIKDRKIPTFYHAGYYIDQDFAENVLINLAKAGYLVVTQNDYD